MKFATSFLGFLLLFAFYPLHSETSEASTLIAKALDRDVQMRVEQQKYEYDLHILSQKLDGKGQVIRTKTTQLTLRPNKEIKFETEIDTSEEAKRQAKEKEKRVKQNQKIMAIMDFKKLAPRFTIALTGTELVRNMDCAIITFTPKPDQPYNSREEKVVNHLAGKVWIDRKTHSIIQYEAHLTEPVSVAWFFASMESLNCQYTSMTLPDGDVVPANFTLFFNLSTTVADIREKNVSTMSNYRIAKK